MKKFLIAALLALGIGATGSYASAQEYGDRYRGIVGCFQLEDMNQIVQAWRTGPHQRINEITRFLFAGQKCGSLRGSTTKIGEVIEVVGDFEGDLMIVYHPVARDTGEVLRNMVFLTWDIHHLDTDA